LEGQKKKRGGIASTLGTDSFWTKGNKKKKKKKRRGKKKAKH